MDKSVKRIIYRFSPQAVNYPISCWRFDSTSAKHQSRRTDMNLLRNGARNDRNVEAHAAKTVLDIRTVRFNICGIQCICI